MTNAPGAIEPSPISRVQDLQNQIGFITATKSGRGSRANCLIKSVPVKSLPAEEQGRTKCGSEDVNWEQVTRGLEPPIPTGNTVLVHSTYCEDRVFRMILEPLTDLRKKTR